MGDPSRLSQPSRETGIGIQISAFHSNCPVVPWSGTGAVALATRARSRENHPCQPPRTTSNGVTVCSSPPHKIYRGEPRTRSSGVCLCSACPVSETCAACEHDRYGEFLSSFDTTLCVDTTLSAIIADPLSGRQVKSVVSWVGCRAVADFERSCVRGSKRGIRRGSVSSRGR